MTLFFTLIFFHKLNYSFTAQQNKAIIFILFTIHSTLSFIILVISSPYNWQKKTLSINKFSLFLFFFFGEQEHDWHVNKVYRRGNMTRKFFFFCCLVGCWKCQKSHFCNKVNFFILSLRLYLRHCIKRRGTATKRKKSLFF